MKLILISILGIAMIMGGVYGKYALAQSDNPQTVNIQQLAWEIKQGTGVNCGGYYETDGTPQKCNLTYNNVDGVIVTLDSDTESRRAEIDQVIKGHKGSETLPPDYPARPTAVPKSTLKEKYQAATTDSERINILAEAMGLADQVSTAKN